MPIRGAGHIVAPYCRIRNSADQAIPNGAVTLVTFNTDVEDPTDMHSTVTNTGRVTIAMPGIYSIVGNFCYEPNATGTRAMYIELNAVTNLAESHVPVNSASYYTMFNIADIIRLAAGDYVSLYTYQNSGGNLNSKSFGSNLPHLVVVWLSP